MYRRQWSFKNIELGWIGLIKHQTGCYSTPVLPGVSSYSTRCSPFYCVERCETWQRSALGETTVTLVCTLVVRYGRRTPEFIDAFLELLPNCQGRPPRILVCRLIYRETHTRLSSPHGGFNDISMSRVKKNGAIARVWWELIDSINLKLETDGDKLQHK